MLSLSEWHSFPLFNSKITSERMEEEGPCDHMLRKGWPWNSQFYPQAPLVSIVMFYAHLICLLSWILPLNFTTTKIVVYSFSAQMGPSGLPYLVGLTSGLTGGVDPPT